MVSIGDWIGGFVVFFIAVSAAMGYISWDKHQAELDAEWLETHAYERDYFDQFSVTHCSSNGNLEFRFGFTWSRYVDALPWNETRVYVNGEEVNATYYDRDADGFIDAYAETLRIGPLPGGINDILVTIKGDAAAQCQVTVPVTGTTMNETRGSS